MEDSRHPVHVGQFKVIRCGEGRHATDVQGGVWSKDHTGRVHQKEVGASEASSLNGAEDVGDVSTRDATEDVRCRRQASVQRSIEKIRDVVGGYPEVAETVKQISAAIGSGAASDVVLGLPATWNRSAHMRV